MKFVSLLLCLLFLTGCAAREVPGETTEAVSVPETTFAAATTPETTAVTLPLETTPPDPIREMLDQMSLEERVGQLFLARCDENYALEHIESCHLGGFVLFGRDFENQTPDSLRQKLSAYQDAAKIPLLIAVDEEGGTVTRVSGNPAFRSQRFPSPRTAYAQGGMEGALLNEDAKCALLDSLGVSVNLGPVCDITTDPDAFLYQRSLGLSPEETAAVAKMMENARTLEKAKMPREEKQPEEEDQAVEDTAYFQSRQRIAELLSGLDETDAKLLTLRFGLEGGLPLPPEDVGRKLGLTPEEVTAREAAALSVLRTK